MDDFRAHEGWCPNGAAPDGRRRLDMFPEWGDAFPLWEAGNGCSDEPLSEDVTAALHSWNREWELTAGDTGSRVPDHAAWVTRGEGLAQRVEEQTGAVVIVLGPERRGPASGCTHCGPDAAAVDDAADLIQLNFRSIRAFIQRAEASRRSGDLGSVREDIDAARDHMKALRNAVRRSGRHSA